VKRLPANLGRGIVGVFSRDNLAPLLIGGAATGGASFLDDNVRRSAADPESGFGKIFEQGGGSVTVVFVAGMFAGGRLAHGSRFRAMTYDMLDAAIVNGGYTQVLKFVTRRERPDGSNKHSFPSGHASSAFTLATIVERHYGWAVGGPAYALAATIGYSRIVRDKHFLSDVVAGATLGFIVGRTTARLNGQPLSPGKVAWSLEPLLGRRTAGMVLSVHF
jgi:membrane-associated phospholipid phosphatase